MSENVMSANAAEPRKYGPFSLISVWPDPDEEAREKVVKFWTDNGVFSADNIEQANQRARQLLVMAVDDQGTIAGVSTAFKHQIDQLGFPCFYYRTFVAPEHRKLWMLSKELFHASYDALNQRFLDKHDPECLGVFLELQNEMLMRHLKYAVWEADGMNVVYVGRSAQGQHRRVWYFEGAKVP